MGVGCLGRKTSDYVAEQKIYSSKLRELMINDDIDVLVCISRTLYLGYFVLGINKVLGKLIFLWGLNELSYNYDKIELNSVCGVKLNDSNLFESGFKS